MPLHEQIEAYLKAQKANLSLSQVATMQQAVRIAAALPAAEGDDDDPKVEGDDDEPKVEGDDDEPKVEGDDDEPKGEGDEEDAEARIFAILDHPEAQGRAPLARVLAKQGLPLKDAVAALKAAPKSSAKLDQIRNGAPAAIKPGTGSEASNDVVSRVKSAQGLLKKRR